MVTTLRARRERKVAMEKSCGAVIIHWKNGEPLYLVVKHRNRHWDVPKGHIEPGESEYETARREIKEETCLEVDLVGDFRYEITYSRKPESFKTAVYFIGVSKKTEVICNIDELVDYQWLPFTQALNLISYDKIKVLLVQANTYITGSLKP